MKFRPCIDLHNGKVKQIVGASLSDQNEQLIENFVSEHDAAFYAKMYQQDQLDGGHVIKLGPGCEEEALKALKAYPGGLQIGGGINCDNAQHYLDAGASQVIVTSYVFKNGQINFDNLKKLEQTIGKDKLVLDLSCRKRGNDFFVVTDRWQHFTDYKISATHIAELEKYCCEFLIHAADVEGKCAGIQTAVLLLLADYVSVPCTYAGGVAQLADLDLIYSLGRNKIDLTIGSALDIFGGSLAYQDVVNWHQQHKN